MPLYIQPMYIYIFYILFIFFIYLTQGPNIGSSALLGFEPSDARSAKQHPIIDAHTVTFRSSSRQLE